MYVIRLIIYLFILFPLFSKSQVISVIPAGSEYKYFDQGGNLGSTWRSLTYNDSAWSSGFAQLGYGDGDETTVVNYGNDSANKFITTYFRKSFHISDPYLYSSFKLKILRDDGARVFLNGKRVAITNMPVSGVNFQTPAKNEVTGTNETKFFGFNLAPALFLAGNNILAVEVHQVNPASDDLGFDLKLEATPVTTCGTPLLLTTDSVSSSYAWLSWSPVAGGINYLVNYRPTGQLTWYNVSSSIPSIVLSGLVSMTQYEFKVQAVCSVPGEFSALSSFTTIHGTDTLVTSESVWKVLDDGSNQGTLWKSVSFNDSAWAGGSAELGYGDGDEATTVSYGPNAGDKYITTYFRKKFNVLNPATYTDLKLDFVRDDGLVVFLNGAEVYRNNMPAGTITHSTLASSAISGTGESNWNTVLLNPGFLVAGINVIAVEIHQVSASSSDISFNTRLYASSAQPIVALTRGAYLQQVTNNSIIIRWRTNLACNSRVQFGTSLNYGFTETVNLMTTEHKVTLTNLNPATRYYYNVGSTSQVIQGDLKNNFYTAPDTGTSVPVRIWATGDFGNGSIAQAAVRNAFVNYTGTTPVNLWIWLGDNAYANGLDNEYQNNVFNQYPDLLKSIPLYPAPGNHDYANVGYQGMSSLTTNFPYFNIFTVPQAGEAGGIASGTPKYYSYNYSNIHFVSLDSYGSLNNAGSPMYNWLNDDLAANTQRWTIVYFHHPPYSKGTHNSDTENELVEMRTNIIPLLESHHVDLVLCGHSHTNERSYLIKGHFGLASSFNQSMKISNGTNLFTKTSPFEGTVYAVCGTAGQGSTVTSPGYPMACMYFNNNTNNCSLILDVNGDNLDCKYLSSAGTIADQFTMTKVGGRDSFQAMNDENVFSAWYDSNEIILKYLLNQDAYVSIELVNIHGERINLFNQIPAYQVKGYYQFHLPVSELSASQGMFFILMKQNGKQKVKKVLLYDHQN